jgi:hypothetical protein
MGDDEISARKLMHSQQPFTGARFIELAACAASMEPRPGSRGSEGFGNPRLLDGVLRRTATAWVTAA